MLIFKLQDDGKVLENTHLSNYYFCSPLHQPQSTLSISVAFDSVANLFEDILF